MDKQYTASNIKFLRQGLDITVEHLAELVNIHPSDLLEVESIGWRSTYTWSDYTDSASSPNIEGACYLYELIKISTFFTIYVEDLVYSDLQNLANFNINILASIKSELAGGTIYDRSQYCKSFLEVDDDKIYYFKEELLDKRKFRMKVLRHQHEVFMMNEEYHMGL